MAAVKRLPGLHQNALYIFLAYGDTYFIWSHLENKSSAYAYAGLCLGPGGGGSGEEAR